MTLRLGIVEIWAESSPCWSSIKPQHTPTLATITRRYVKMSTPAIQFNSQSHMPHASQCLSVTTSSVLQGSAQTKQHGDMHSYDCTGSWRRRYNMAANKYRHTRGVTINKMAHESNPWFVIITENCLKHRCFRQFLVVTNTANPSPGESSA